MRSIIDLGRDRRGGVNIMSGPASVECEREVRACCWPRSLRSVLDLIVPRCFCPSGAVTGEEDADSKPGPTVTGTIFGRRRGRVAFCVQEDSRSPPLLLLEFAMSTYFLAKEMQYGLLRVTLECDGNRTHGGSRAPLLSVPVWMTYCNGRKVGFAVRRQPTETDREVLRLLKSVSAGAGVIPLPAECKVKENEEEAEGEFLYMRATYQRVVGSRDSESFHLINPGGTTGQELSVFFFRT